MTHAAMLGLGVYRPERVVTNDEICEVLDSNDEWIQSRSGIRTRRFAGEDETLIGMATAAAERALAVAGVAADQLGCVIVATSTHPEHTPASAPQVATRLGSTTAAFDVSAGCAGFCHALNLASAMVRSGAEKYVLVIGVEQLSRFMDPTDRGTAFIFADGAGAVVVGPADATGIGPTAWGSDGSQAHVINQTPSCLGGHGSGADHPVVQMEGTAVFRWAPFAMAVVAHEALRAAGISLAARLFRAGAPDVAVVESESVHRYRPLLSYVGAGEARMKSLERPASSVVPDGCRWIHDEVVTVDAEGPSVLLRGGRRIGCSTLVVATGLEEDWDATPGLREAYAAGWAGSTFVVETAPRVWPALRDLTGGRVVFTVPPEPAPCAATALKPLFMACDHWRRAVVRHDVGVRDVVELGVAAGGRDGDPAWTHAGDPGVPQHLHAVRRGSWTGTRSR